MNQGPLIYPGLRESVPGQDASAALERVLSRGGLVILPTETVYGVGADPSVPGAIDALYRAKERPREKQIPLLAGSEEQVCAMLGEALPPLARKLAAAFWPGPLTLAFESRGQSWGFRVPDHAFTRRLLLAHGAPLAVTSANKSGEPPALDAITALAVLAGHVDLVFDGGRSEGGVPSSVVRVDGARMEILREGALSAERLRSVIEESDR